MGAPLVGPVNIIGPRDTTVDVLCTDPPPSQVKLMAVNSNGVLEGQIQFLGQFSLTGISGTNSNPDGHGVAMTYTAVDAANNQVGTLVLYRPHHNPGIILDPRTGITMDVPGGNPVVFTGTGSAEQNRYLQLINSSGHTSASGLKAGGILVADDYSFAKPDKNTLFVKGQVAIGTGTPIPQPGGGPATRLDVHGNAIIRNTLDVEGSIFSHQLLTSKGLT